MDHRHENVLVLGANPAWQKTVVCDRLRPGEVVRVRLEASGAAGKGFNTARAVRAFGIPVRLVSAAGPDASEWQEACRDEGIPVALFPIRGRIRTATTVHDLATGEVTEIVEEGPEAADGAELALESALRQDSGRVSMAAVAGTFPQGLSPRVALEVLSGLDVPVVLDSVPGLRALRDGAPCPSRAILKLNETEWTSLLGEPDLSTALRQARRLWPSSDLLATRGKAGAVLVQGDGARFALVAEPYPMDVRVQPIGGGDAFTGGLLVGLSNGSSLLEAACHGMAVARASCLNPLPARFSMEEVAISLGLVRAEPIDA